MILIKRRQHLFFEGEILSRRHKFESLQRGMIPGSPAHSEARRKPVTLRAFEISRRSCIELWIIATSKLRVIGCQAKSFVYKCYWEKNVVLHWFGCHTFLFLIRANRFHGAKRTDGKLTGLIVELERVWFCNSRQFCAGLKFRRAQALEFEPQWHSNFSGGPKVDTRQDHDSWAAAIIPGKAFWFDRGIKEEHLLIIYHANPFNAHMKDMLGSLTFNISQQIHH